MSRIIFSIIASAFFLFALALSDACAGEKRPLSGSASGALDVGEYLVKSTLTVQAGDTFSIRAGAVLYFDQLTGIDVAGELCVDGTPGERVVMASVNDTAGSSEPAHGFDWNGVKTTGAEAVVRLRYVDIRNSVYGVNIRDTLAKAELAGVAFQNNGYASLVRGNDIMPIPAGEPFNALWNIDTPAQARQDDRMPAKKQSRVNARFIFNASAVSVAVVGMTVYCVGLSNNNVYFRHYSQDDNSKRLSAYYENEIRGSINVSTVGAVMAGIGLGCMGVSLFF
ncbi:MAG: hypothetical protein LBH93_02930 [Chitinispirillales bacterium]|jgi:hypothetical protein|nr:hypothetical protein [Chitinispirillales bacterium]